MEDLKLLLKEQKKILDMNIPEKSGKISGQIKIEKVFSDGRKEVILDDKNLVVNQAGNIMAQMSIGSRTMSYIELGDQVSPSQPALDNLVLDSATGVRVAVAANVVGNTGIYVSTFDTSTGNGFTFTEAGLFSSPFGTGLLFARKIFDPIVKDNFFSIVITWAISYGVANAGSSTGCQGIQLIGNSTITEDFAYNAVGGEDELVVPIVFTVGSKQLDVYLERLRLVYNVDYDESVLGGGDGIRFLGFTLAPGDLVYIVKKTLS